MADQILKFLQDHNRPFTVNEIIQGIGEKMGKAKVQKILDELTTNEKVLEKVYSKQKIYCIRQAENVPSNQINEEMRKIDREINEITANIRDVEKELQEKGGLVKGLKQSVSMKDALNMKNTLEAEIAELQDQLDNIEAKSKTFTDEDKKDITKNYERLVKEYRKRKRLCMDIFDAIYENYPKTKKLLLQEIGLEMDEDVGFTLKVAT